MNAEVMLVRIVLCWCKHHGCSDEMLSYFNSLSINTILDILKGCICAYYDDYADSSTIDTRQEVVVNRLVCLYNKNVVEEK